jgi:TM2 domain-containing membrane protein YozV
VSKKNPWVLSFSLAAFVLAPALHSADSAEAKAPVKAEKAADSAAVESAKSSSDKPSTEAVKDAIKKEEPAKTDDNVAKADEKTGAKEDKGKASNGHKSKAIAGGLAFFPGVAIHGAGHMYAGSWMKGLGLLAIEGAAIGGLTQSVGGLTDATKVFNGGKSVPTDVSAVYTTVGLALVSSMALIWSWFDDMAGAPVAVVEYNKIQDQNATAQFRVNPRGDGAELALSTNF